MRLINADTLRLEEYFGDDIPPYSILSHTWGADEVSLQAFQGPGRGQNHQGYAKIAAACTQSLEQGIRYTWVDTCCIDKTSSAELTEAINSMFDWYSQALVCFAYLADKPPQEPFASSAPFIGGSKWFTRGWTLQELLAPRHVEFYAADWSYISTRHALATQISKATTIAKDYLVNNPLYESRRVLLSRASMAQRMSWASTRNTTRKEDQAYCLLGLFGVSMPLIYGEGSNAFIRLQEEILRRSFDPTLLARNPRHEKRPLRAESLPSSKLTSAWRYIRAKENPWKLDWEPSIRGANMGFLAPSPRHFTGCGGLLACRGLTLYWSLTPKGLKVNLPVSNSNQNTGSRPYIVIPCYHRDNPAELLAIPMVRSADGSFCRATEKALFVHHDRWHLWARSTTYLAVASSGGPAPFVALPEKSITIWVRSVPPGCKFLGLLGPSGGPELTRSKQGSCVSWPSEYTSRQTLAVRLPDGTKLGVCVSYEPYAKHFSERYGMPEVCMRDVLDKASHFSVIFMDPEGDIPPATQALPKAAGSDYIVTPSGFISADVTTRIVAAAPLVLIDIRYGPQRIGHLSHYFKRDRAVEGNTNEPKEIGGITKLLFIACFNSVFHWLKFVYNINYDAPAVFVVTPGMWVCNRWDCLGTRRAGATDGDQSSSFYPEVIPLLVLSLVLCVFALLRPRNSDYVSTVPLVQERRTFSTFALPLGLLQFLLMDGSFNQHFKSLIMYHWEESPLLSAVIHIAPGFMFYPHSLAVIPLLSILDPRRAAFYRRYRFVLAALAVLGLALGLPDTYLGLRGHMMWGFVVWPILVR